MEQLLILVDEHDREIGQADKSTVHQQGLLHRAFSIFLFNSRGEMLLQKRAQTKYHSAGLWSNACCSHPNAGEDLANAVQRRLKEELGISTPLQKLFSFTYRVEFGNGMIEHEFDHVFVGEFDGQPIINPAEVAGYRYDDIYAIERNLAQKTEQFTVWFRLAFPKVLHWWDNKNRVK